MRYLVARRGTAEFFVERVVLVKAIGSRPAARVALGWGELAGFRDGSADYVQLVRPVDLAPSWARVAHLFRSGVPSHSLTISTLDEASRARVLAILVERGLARLD